MSEFPKLPVRSLSILEAGSSISPKSLTHAIATIGSEISCDKSVFDSYSYDGWKDIHHDLLIVCAAVEYADRRWARGLKRWARQINVTVPVTELTTWLDAEVQNSLHEVLRHLTGDNWRFTFVQSESGASDTPRQRPLFPTQSKDFAIAYSDGLDSLCVSGLLNQDSTVRVRVTKHSNRQCADETPFDRVPFDVSVKPSREDSARSRGFKFASITAIAAHISKVNRIVVPESGQGSLGPVLVPLRNVYPDYRNHPTFFRRMEHFIFHVLGINLTYEQPRLWYTKGQTIAAFLEKPGAQSKQVVGTRSCWQQRFNVRVEGKLRQCGICAACQLRRMSLYVAGVDEPVDTYAVCNLKLNSLSAVLSELDDYRASSTLSDYGIMGTRHLQQLTNFATESDARLKPYVFELAEALGKSMGDVNSQLRFMLQSHSAEWNAFVTAQGDRSFIKLWTMGGRHG